MNTVIVECQWGAEGTDKERQKGTSQQQEKNKKINIFGYSKYTVLILTVFNINQQLSTVLLKFLMSELLIPDSIVSIYL